jgi:hypothetical protein
MRALKKGTYRTVPGEYYGTPKEIWGFRRKGTGKPRQIAKDFLAANADLLGLGKKISGLRFQKTIHSLSAHHLIFQQIYCKRRVHRAYVTVHVANDDRVYLAKNRAMPVDLITAKPKFDLSKKELVRRARRALPQKSRRSELQDMEEMWYPVEDRLIPVCRVRLARRLPAEEWIIYVNAATGGIVSKYDNLSWVKGRALVFQPSPTTALNGYEDLLNENMQPIKPPLQAYRLVTLWDLDGTGQLDGKRVSTMPTHPRHRIRRRSHDFLFESEQSGFEAANVYHHIDSAIYYLETLGYSGSKRIFKSPLKVNVNGTPEDNSWYSPWNKQLTFGTGDVDDAEDGETILHEFGHALQDAIVPDFGQSTESAAMGEGFGDYFAASFFAADKPERYRACVMTWDGLYAGLQTDSVTPCLRRVDHDWTYDDFDPDDDEHDNGEIWSATLWDIYNQLGGEMADRLIVESHFQLDGFTSFAKGARAIIDADRSLNRGRNAKALKSIFRKRKIRPV